MQLSNLGKYIVELRLTTEYGPKDKMVLLLANTKYDSNVLLGYRMNLYVLQLQYLHNLHAVFELRSAAVLFYFVFYSTNYSVDIYYSSVIRRKPTARTHEHESNTVSSKRCAIRDYVHVV